MKMNKNFFKGICLIIISCYSTQTTAKCPSDEVIFPCKCSTYSTTGTSSLYCGGNDYYNLKNIFIRLSSALNETEKHFRSFLFNNTAIYELERNVFYDIKFESIGIDSAYNLTLINTHAFLSTSGSVKSFHLWHTPYGNTITDSNNIFNALNAMIDIEHITLMNTSLTSIPANAFTVLNKLQYLFIENNRNLRSFGDNAFYELTNLAELLLSNNPIDHFSDHSLAFRSTTKLGYLHFYFFSLPNITSNSFSRGSLAAIKRPFILYLYGFPEFKYLDEHVFKDVLANENRNRIDLNRSTLECDCRMYWLYANQAEKLYDYYVWNAICTDGKSVFADRPAYNDCNAN